MLVQEVDQARGRIGLKLVQKHENGGWSLGGSSAGGGRPPRRRTVARAATVVAVRVGRVATAKAHVPTE